MSNTTTPPAPAKGIPVEHVWKNPPAFLLSYGWRAEGDPQSPGAIWFDPTKPEKTVERKVKVGEHKTQSGKIEEVYQIHIDPAAWGMSRDEAITLQLARLKEKEGR